MERATNLGKSETNHVRVAIISDTHDLLRPEAVKQLERCDRILHIGDVCSRSVYERVANVAPLEAVRGNCDTGDWADELPLRRVSVFEDLVVYSVHRREDLDLDPAAADIEIVFFGHSHEPLREEQNGVLYFNPGSAGPKRFSLPTTMALLEVYGRDYQLSWIDAESGSLWSPES